MGELERLLVARIEANGPIGFDEYQANALYAPESGFYQRGGGAGRRRDFLTSPEVGPLFGAVIARALDTWWYELGRPDPYVVIDAGAGPGTLARAILRADPHCSRALDLMLVEVAPIQWATHPAGVRSAVELPAPHPSGAPAVVLANELLDNMAISVCERTTDAWVEIVVDVSDGRLVEGTSPLPEAQQRWCAKRAPDAPVGGRIPVLGEAAAWLTRAVSVAGNGGRVVAIDYARSTAEMASVLPSAWLRTYADHGRAAGPLHDPGSYDITADVAMDQLALVADPSIVQSQAAFLRSHGIDELVDEGRRGWERMGLAGGLEALAARSRVTEAQALLDPFGLGGFTVAQWVR